MIKKRGRVFESTIFDKKKKRRCDVAIFKKSEFCHLNFLMSFQNCTTFFVCGNKKKIF